MRRPIRRFLPIAGLAYAAACSAPTLLLAQNAIEAPAAARDTVVELTPQAETALRGGLNYLATTQRSDGAWDSKFGHNVGVASLALLSFLSAGHVPEQGSYAEVIDRGIAYIISQVQPGGMIHNPDATSHGPMYEHALATLLLAEVYGMSERPEIPTAIQGAVRVIVNAQNDEGGWRYQPFARDADVSVTVMQTLALRSAQRAGFFVPAETMERAVRYVKRCAERNGGFLYQAGFGHANFARTAAGVCSLEVLGQFEAEEVVKGLAYLQSHIGSDQQLKDHYHYGVYYGAQAVYLAKDDSRWRQWFPPIREQVLGLQREDGSWESNEVGPAYGTSTMVLALAIPYRCLPIYQR